MAWYVGIGVVILVGFAMIAGHVLDVDPAFVAWGIFIFFAVMAAGRIITRLA